MPKSKPVTRRKRRVRRRRPPYAVSELARRLDAAYPEVECALHYRNAFELLVATILSAQCTDTRVNIVTQALFQKYDGPADYLAVPQEALEADIRTTGFFRNKAKNIRGACTRILHEYGGEVPDTMEELLTLPGVARKTANVVLGTWFGKADGVVVDTHVTRLSGRLGLTSHTDPTKIEVDLMAHFPQEHWIRLAHQLIWHGRLVCGARKADCPNCCFNDICPASKLPEPTPAPAGKT